MSNCGIEAMLSFRFYLSGFGDATVKLKGIISSFLLKKKFEKL